MIVLGYSKSILFILVWSKDLSNHASGGATANFFNGWQITWDDGVVLLKVLEVHLAHVFLCFIAHDEAQLILSRFASKLNKIAAHVVEFIEWNIDKLPAALGKLSFKHLFVMFIIDGIETGNSMLVKDSQQDIRVENGITLLVFGRECNQLVAFLGKFW